MRDALDRFGSTFVVGGTSEIALAIVRRLADRDGRLVLAGRDAAALGRAAASTEVRDVATERFDALEPGDAEPLLDRVWEAGDVDLVVLAAGVLGDEGRARSEPAHAIATWQVNFVGAGAVLLGATRRMREQGHGTIVVLSSVAGERPRASNAVYGASKAGLDALAQGLADEVHGSGVRMLVVRPGFVRTRMTRGLDPAPLATTAEAVAERVAAGLAADAHTVWAPSAMRWVMAVLRHVPRPLFRRLPI